MKQLILHNKNLSIQELLYVESFFSIPLSVNGQVDQLHKKQEMKVFLLDFSGGAEAEPTVMPPFFDMECDRLKYNVWIKGCVADRKDI